MNLWSHDNPLKIGLEEMTAELVAEARRLEAAGAALLNFTNSAPVAGTLGRCVTPSG